MLDLGNIADLSVPLIAEEYSVRQASVGLESCADPSQVSGDPAHLPNPSSLLGTGIRWPERTSCCAACSGPTRRGEFAAERFLLRSSRHARKPNCSAR